MRVNRNRENYVDTSYNPYQLPPLAPSSQYTPVYTGSQYQDPTKGLARQASAGRYQQDNHSQSSQKSKSAKKTLEDYEFTNTGDLGQGSYGTVRLAIDKISRERFAIKIMQKSQIFKYCSVNNLKREIRIQKRMLHPNICRLFHYFEDRQNVYLVLEYAPKGNLFSVLRKAHKMNEETAFNYFFQTCMAIDYLHRNGVIHRDLKPENLLVDSSNNIKVCDFGWSADNSYAGAARTTFCGTVDYMAPEMVKRSSHDHRIDLWSMGVLLYELIHGYPPFHGQTQNQKLENIQRNQPVKYRPDLEFDLVDLMKGILQPNPDYRLSMDSIFHHPWMYRQYAKQGIDISRVLQKQESIRPTADTETSFQKDYSRTRSADNRNFTKHSDYYTNEENVKRNQNQGNQPLNRLDEEDEDNLANSAISVTYQNIKQLNQKHKAQEEQESFFDKILIAFGCISRDKNKK